jgi:hypothetical protein
MFGIILFVYWIFSTIFVNQSLKLGSDCFKTRVIIGNISILFGWLILPVAILFSIFELLKKIFL